MYQNISLQRPEQKILSDDRDLFTSPSGRYFPLIFRDDKNNKRSAVTLEINEITMDPCTKQFKIKNIKKITNAVQFYEKYDNILRKETRIDMFISDEAEILAINLSKNEVMYEGVNIYNHVQSKLGKHPLYHKFNEPEGLNCCMKNGGFVLYNKHEVYFLRASSMLGIQATLIQLGLHIVESLTTIEEVYSNPDPTLVVIGIKDSIDYIFIVWDVIVDKEIYRFRSEGKCLFISGRKTKAGYLINGSGYIVDLDQQIINFNFRTQILSSSFSFKKKNLMMFESKFYLINI